MTKPKQTSALTLDEAKRAVARMAQNTALTTSECADLAALYQLVLKQQRRIQNQVRELTRLREKLEGAKPERLARPAVDDTEAA